MIVTNKKNDPDFGLLYEYKFKPEPLMFINNKYFVDFTSQCNFDLEKIDDEICELLAKTPLDKYPMVHGLIPPLLREKEIDGEFENTVKYNYNGNREILKSMNEMEKRKYLFFKHKSIIPWFFILDLKPNKFSTKTKDLYPWNDYVKNIPYTKECILHMPFKEIGRVVIYGSWSESRVPCHRDKLPSKEYEHHINFNPGGYRPVYIYDSLNDKKHYLPKDYKFYAYNTSDFHGVDPLPYFSYTIRVDGMYNENAIKIVNQ